MGRIPVRHVAILSALMTLLSSRWNALKVLDFLCVVLVGLVGMILRSYVSMYIGIKNEQMSSLDDHFLY